MRSQPRRPSLYYRILAEYDTSARTLDYVNAGHNPPVLRPRSGDLQFLRDGGLPLGINSSALYQNARVELYSGDVLVSYTDGVVEAFNGRGEEFGEDRWFVAIRALPEWDSESIVRQLLLRVDEFVGPTCQSDDITCLVLRIK